MSYVEDKLREAIDIIKKKNPGDTFTLKELFHEDSNYAYDWDNHPNENLSLGKLFYDFVKVCNNIQVLGKDSNNHRRYKIK